MRSVPASDQGPRRAILGKLPRMYRPDGSPIRVLLVDDERALTNLVRMALQYEGWEIDVAHDAAEAVGKYRANTPDILVLDIMLPDMDGLGVLQQIRDSETYTPTLFLTARDSVVDRVTGLTAGGDDYMTKPFSLEELVARLRGLLRRSAYLTPAEFELLRLLMRNPRKALSRNEVLRRVWDYDFGGRSSIVDLYISYLRRKIDAGREPMIHTVRGVGYMLRPPE
jgi:two-component system response regulator TrcR